MRGPASPGENLEKLQVLGKYANEANKRGDVEDAAILLKIKSEYHRSATGLSILEKQFCDGNIPDPNNEIGFFTFYDQEVFYEIILANPIRSKSGIRKSITHKIDKNKIVDLARIGGNPVTLENIREALRKYHGFKK